MRFGLSPVDVQGGRLDIGIPTSAGCGGGRVCRLRCVACALLRSAGLPRLCRLACLGDGGIPQDDFAGISQQCFCLTRGNSAACYPRMRPSCDRPGLSTEGVTQRARMLAPCTDFADWGRGSPAPLLVALQLAIAISLEFLESRRCQADPVTPSAAALGRLLLRL